MKNSNYLILFVLFSTAIFFISKSLNFNPKTGDEKFDLHISKINSDALANLNEFKTNVSLEYHVDEASISNLFSSMEPAEILLSYEMARLVNKPISNVISLVTNFRSSGWNTILKKMGISKNSPHFIDLCKISVVNPLDKNNTLSKK